MTVQVFSAAWFQRHQRPLRALLATPVIGRELRDALAIRRHDVGWDRRIVWIGPRGYIVANDDGTYTLDARTHAKYGRRLHAQWQPLWRAAHAWDRFVATPLVPALDLGFATLPFYPDADPETTCCDGAAFRGGVDEAFATIRGGAGTTGSATDAANYLGQLWGSATTNQYQELDRGFFLFDVQLGTGATISAATLSFWGTAKASNLGTTPLEVCGATPASNTNIVAGDFVNVARVEFGTCPFASYDATDTVYTDIALNASGLAAIPVAGIAKFSTQLEWDRANSFTGSWVNSATYLIARYADFGGAANDPKLTVTYTGRQGLPTQLHLSAGDPISTSSPYRTMGAVRAKFAPGLGR